MLGGKVSRHSQVLQEMHRRREKGLHGPKVASANVDSRGRSLTGARDIHHHQAAVASEATRGWWMSRGGGYSCHPGLSTSPKWLQKQGPPGGGGYLSFPQAWVSMTSSSALCGALLAKMLIPMISSVSQCGHLMCPTADDSDELAMRILNFDLAPTRGRKTVLV